jgi:hypothetical protein
VKQKRLAVGVSIGILIAAGAFGLLLVSLVYPEVKVQGYDPNPLQTMNKDLEKDSARLMLFVGVFLVGLICSAVVGVWLWRRPSAPSVVAPKR